MTRDARSSVGRSLRVPVATMLRQPGVRHPFRRSVAVDELRVGSATIPADSGAVLDLLIEAINDAVTVSGTVSADFEAICGRCLDGMVQRVDAEVKEIFERRPVEGETYLLDAGHIDLEPLVRDALILALPIAPLCGADCEGAAPDLFPLPAGGEGQAEMADPRWAALSDLDLD